MWVRNDWSGALLEPPVEGSAPARRFSPSGPLIKLAAAGIGAIHGPIPSIALLCSARLTAAPVGFFFKFRNDHFCEQNIEI